MRHRPRRTSQALLAFMSFLRSCSMGGTLMQTWRGLLDPDGCLYVQKADVQRACAQVGWRGDVSILWSALDAPNGRAALEEFGFKEARALAMFRSWAMAAAGGLEEAWQRLLGVERGFQRRRRGSVVMAQAPSIDTLDRQAFVFAVGRIQAPGKAKVEDPDYLFSILDWEPNGKLQYKDLRFLEYWEPVKWLCEQPDAQVAASFKETVLSKYGNHPVKAWRLCLDMDGTGICRWVAFNQACDRIQWKGDAMAAWNALNLEGSDILSEREMDFLDDMELDMLAAYVSATEASEQLEAEKHQVEVDPTRRSSTVVTDLRRHSILSQAQGSDATALLLSTPESRMELMEIMGLNDEVSHLSASAAPTGDVTFGALPGPVTLGKIDYLTGEPLSRRLASMHRGKRKADVLRDELARYDVYAYDGGFRYRQQEVPEADEEDLPSDSSIYISGSWNGFAMEDSKSTRPGSGPTKSDLEGSSREAGHSIFTIVGCEWLRAVGCERQADPPEPADRLLQLGACLIVGAGVCAWAPAFQYKMFNNGFFMDDAMIARNPQVIHDDFSWYQLFRTDYWGLDMFAGTWTHKSFRPLAVLTFRWNFLWHGFESSGFHVTNLILHFVSSCLLAVFGALSGFSRWRATLLGGLFLVHPVHTESVLYIVGRADLICLSLIMISSLVHLKTSPPKSFVVAFFTVLISSILLIAAGLCKETGFCFFGLLVGWDFLWLTWQPYHGRLWFRMLLLLVLGILCCGLRLWYTGTTIERMDPYSNPVAAEKDPVVRFLSYALVHGIYGKLLVWPNFLCYDYSFDAIPLVRSLVDCRLLLPISCYLGFFSLISLSLRAAQQRRELPIVGMAVLILSFLPMSNVLFPVGTMVGERLLYIPSAGLLITVLGLVQHRGGTAMLLLAGLVLVILTAQRVPDWSSPEAITVADAMKQKRSTRVQYNLATHHMSNKRYDEALSVFELVMALDPTGGDCMPRYHAGQIHIYKGNTTAAEALLAKAVQGHFSPLLVNEEEVFHDYGLALWFAEKPQDAIVNFEKSLALNNTFTKGMNNLGCALGLGAVLGRLPQEMIFHGIQQLQEAVALSSDSVLYWRNLVALLQFAGQQEAATQAWQQLVALDPNSMADPPQDCSWEFAFR
eukprot:Skav230178  [mRNA]  locus=scaffold196:88617:114594:- [translate_table: standard]